MDPTRSSNPNTSLLHHRQHRQTLHEDLVPVSHNGPSEMREASEGPLTGCVLREWPCQEVIHLALMGCGLQEAPSEGGCDVIPLTGCVPREGPLAGQDAVPLELAWGSSFGILCHWQEVWESVPNREAVKMH